ncbi:MAG: phenylalanine--tRNA ligase subunit beta [Solirubrobacteraceae bacterium]|nr:phenylalanine--tRNA ligase subunit beta [Solirubrobacteraceae bacterium]
MNVPQEWLLSYCDPGLDTAALEERLTDSGTKVEAIHQVGPPSPEGFVVGLVLERTQHPDADRLGVCRVDVGEPEAVQIVCGAPNVGGGQFVPVARVGAVMPGGMKIKKAKLRGVESNGMICSAKELELGLESDGILVLATIAGDPAGLQNGSGQKATKPLAGVDAATLTPGAPLAAALPLGGPAIELEVTPNRPDCLGIYEVARELHAATGAALAPAPWTGVQLPAAVPTETGPNGAPTAVTEGLRVTLSESVRCERFTTVVFDNVKVGPSPPWLAQRLVAAGERPINNVVDITNYVMLETGQPIHAFDLDRVAGGSLDVHSAAAATKVTTLDDQEHEVPAGTILISDAEGPTSIAGIMGGARSEILEGTTRVAIEAATWHGPSIHATSWATAIRTQASSRFEKSLPVEQTLDAQRRALQLMVELTGAVQTGEMIDLGSRGISAPALQLPTSLAKRFLGYDVPEARQIELLRAIDLGVESSGTGVLTVTIPPRRRNDLTRPIDLIEEISRLDGLANVPATLPAGRPAGRLTARQRADRALQDLLVGRGLLEVVGWSFGNTDQLDRLGLPASDPLRDAVHVRNPMSSELGQMRTTVVPSLLEVAQRNTARGFRDLQLFELGTTYHAAPESQLPNERRTLGVLLTGSLTVPTWLDPAPAKAGASSALEMVRAIGALLRVPLSIDQSVVAAHLHPGRGAQVVLGGRPVGIVGELHPRIAAAYDLANAVGIVELDAGALLDAMPGRPQYQPFATFPPVSQDLAVVVDAEIPAQRVVDAARSGGTALLRDVSVFDVYTGPGVDDGKRSLALRLTFRAEDRTLTEEEATKARGKILAALEQQVGAVARG